MLTPFGDTPPSIYTDPPDELPLPAFNINAPPSPALPEPPSISVSPPLSPLPPAIIKLPPRLSFALKASPAWISTSDPVALLPAPTFILILPLLSTLLSPVRISTFPDSEDLEDPEDNKICFSFSKDILDEVPNWAEEAPRTNIEPSLPLTDSSPCPAIMDTPPPIPPLPEDIDMEPPTSFEPRLDPTDKLSPPLEPIFESPVDRSRDPD